MNAQTTVRTFACEVVKTYNHSRDAYTQGLFIENGVMYESSGQYGSSSFRRVDIETGRVLEQLDFPRQYFVEGSCVLNGMLYILTWKEHKVFVYDLKSMKKLGEFYNPTEGWGLTTDGESLIMSDGSQKIYFLDPNTFLAKRTIDVKMKGRDIYYLNELEYINGEIYANVYGEDNIVIINPEKGYVTGRILCDGILADNLKKGIDVLNGIAYDKKNRKIYLTGKLWPRLFEVRLHEKLIARDPRR